MVDKLVYGGLQPGGEGDITGCFCWTADKLVYGGLQPGGRVLKCGIKQ